MSAPNATPPAFCGRFQKAIREIAPRVTVDARREIGLRMALGAERRTVISLVVKQGMSLVATGLAAGLAAALLAGHFLAGMLYGVGAADPASIGAATVVLLAAALLACYLPARWASRLDPSEALRES